MEDANEFEKHLKQKISLINNELLKYVPNEASEAFMEGLLGKASYKYDLEAVNKAILAPSRYLLELGGKRWRPALMLLVIEALGKNPEDYLEFSIIPEIIHNATLVHDDIEDRTTSRRGALPIYMKYSEDIAINLGSLLYFLPLNELMDSKKLSAVMKERIVSVYMKEMLRVHIGQATDIAWHNFLVPIEKIGEDEYLQMVYNKTGVLARMACKLGAILAGADDHTVEVLGQFGATIGVGFQLQDDFLNISQSKVAESKGGIGEDITEGKITLMVVYAIRNSDEKESRRLVEILKMHTRDRNLIEEAVGIIDKSGAKDYTKELSRRIVNDAWKSVDKVLKESEAKRKIKSLADFLVERMV